MNQQQLQGRIDLSESQRPDKQFFEYILVNMILLISLGFVGAQNCLTETVHLSTQKTPTTKI